MKWTVNVNGCVKLDEIISGKGEWPLLTRLEVKDCLNLKKIVSCSPMKILRVGTHQKIEILVEKSVLDIFVISTQTNLFDFLLEKKGSFELKSLGENESIDHFLQNVLFEKEKFEKYFKTPKITIGPHSILSQEDLGIFITSLDLRTSEMAFEKFRKIVQLKLKNLRSLQLPRFEREETSFCTDVIQGDWPKLSYLDLSDNELSDEGLAILSQGNWPSLETLKLKHARVTKKGLLNFALRTNCFNLKKIFNPTRSKSLLPGNWDLLKELNLSSSEIRQSEIASIVNRSKWPNLKSLNLSDNNIGDEGLVILSNGNWPLLEVLDLERIQITSVSIEAIVNRSQWSNLKHLNLSSNEITDEGFAILSQGNWSQLEKLNVIRTRVTNKGLLKFYLNVKWPKFQEISLPFNLVSFLSHKKITHVERIDLNHLGITSPEIEAIVNNYKFQRLKYLDISNNEILDEGILLLTLAKWPLLEELDLQNTSVTSKGIEMILNKSKWKKLKHLNLSGNNFSDEGLSFLRLVNWPELEKLNVQNTNITLKGVEIIVSQPMLRWRQLKNLNISNNEIFDEGISIFAQTEWPFLEALFIKNTKITSQGIETLVNKMNLVNLKKLDISGNIIKDEGLQILASAKWHLFQHLVYYDTKVTREGNISLLKYLQWPEFNHLEHSFTESIYSENKDPGKCSLPEIILATASMEYKGESLLVTVLDMNWLDSKEIYLTIAHDNFNEKGMLLPHDKLNELEYIKVSPCPLDVQFIVWPSNLRTLDLSNNSLSYEKKLENLFLTKCPLLENLNLEKTNITAESVEIIISKSDWPCLKKLCLSHNQILDEGLQLLPSGKWPLIETLNLRNTGITTEGIQSLVSTSKWPNLKILDISVNFISDRGLKMLSYGKWPQLENLNLANIGLTADGIQSMVSISEWHSLKVIDISNHYIYDRGLEILCSGTWPGLESLNLKNTSITSEGIANLVEASRIISNMANLKILDISDNFISYKGLKTLSYGKWPQLESLNLKNTRIQQTGIEHMINLSKWPNLKTLDISDNLISDRGLKILFSEKWPALQNLNLRRTWRNASILGVVNPSERPNLKVLDVSYNSLHDEEFQVLFSVDLFFLESLNLKNTSLGEAGIEILVEISIWRHLKILNVSDNIISDQGLALLSSGSWPSLENLNLSNTGLTPNGIQSMIDLSKWPQLKTLDVSQNEMSDMGLKSLSFGKWLFFETLKLKRTNITVEGIKQMIKFSKWSKLKEIHLTDSVENAFIQTLISTKWPRAQLTFSGGKAS